ncbi:cation:proton antiporter [Thiohalobacter sp. IOR34]|uniref:cation:proton antiporter n=1 Tax=Thiohalobacter sp. IOR34 TaxID=3057176 RepID=UPI0025AF45D6|nr:cation:proton antiporter [Thiohalobacter sp. IOR34]WJW76361.1 cation:proton antiporter [Thiohalobacter sp. IOR34]
MAEAEISELLLELTVLFTATYLLGALLTRLRVPLILGAIFVAMLAHYTPLGARLQSPALYPVFSFLADLGVLLLLFFIGLQIDLREMRRQSSSIIWLTVLNTSLPFLFGAAVMLGLGYGWALAFVIGLTRMPTAEAVIVPILDEFNLIRTRVGHFIVGTGVLDDIIEMFMVAFVSVWIGERSLSSSGVREVIENDVLKIVLGSGAFLLSAWLGYRWVIPWLAGLLPRRQTRHLVMLSVLVLFGLGGLSQWAELSMVVGAITAGVLLRPVYNRQGPVGESATQAIRGVTYGFFGLIFFFWVGLSLDLGGLLREPELALLLFAATFVGKPLGTFLLVPMGRLSSREAWVVGIGINAQLTTEIIVAKLLLDARLIDEHLFTALVSASSLSTLLVPLIFTGLIRRWGHDLKRHVPETKGETAHD